MWTAVGAMCKLNPKQNWCMSWPWSKIYNNPFEILKPIHENAINYQETKYKMSFFVDTLKPREGENFDIYSMIQNSQACAGVTHWRHFGPNKVCQTMLEYIEKNTTIFENVARWLTRECWHSWKNSDQVKYSAIFLLDTEIITRSWPIC